MPTIQINLQVLHAGQQRVIDEAKRFNVLECGRRFGKTKLGIDLIVNGALDGWPVAWFAPTYKLISEVWRELLFTLAPLDPKVNQQEKRIELMTGGVIECWSLDQPNAGRSRKYKRVVIDEASLVRELQTAWQGAIRPTLTDFKGDAWFLFTPKGRNFAHRLFAKGEAGDLGWASWRLPTIANPTLDPDEIEAARLEYLAAGVPQVFDQEYLGIPADDGGNPFGLAAIAACVIPALSDKPPVSFGVDLAKSVDFTVSCGLDADGACCRLDRWQSDWGQTRRRLATIIGNTPALIDSTGVGDPVLEDIQRVCTYARGFKFSQASKQQLLEGLASAIQQQQVHFPDGWLRNELDNFEYQFTASGVRYSAPEGMHDDGVIGLALAVKHRKDSAKFSVEMTGPGSCVIE